MTLEHGCLTEEWAHRRNRKLILDDLDMDTDSVHYHMFAAEPGRMRAEGLLMLAPMTLDQLQKVNTAMTAG